MNKKSTNKQQISSIQEFNPIEMTNIKTQTKTKSFPEHPVIHNLYKSRAVCTISFT